MGTELLSKDYLTLLKEDIPNGREDLINTSKTLEDVAEHCLNSYDKSLEQTVNYTAQALGSVAYKINLLATNFIEVLDQQNIKLNGLQTKVNHLNMQVRIHQEKTARLSIGKYTLPRDPTAMRPSKTIEPIQEINGRYRRREIDFSILDNVGHGMKDPQLGGSAVVYGNNSRRSSTSGTGSDTHSSAHTHSHSNSMVSGGTNVGSEYSKYGKGQTVGRGSGLAQAMQGVENVYRSPGTMPQRIQTPMVSPIVSNNASIYSPPPTATNYGTAMNFPPPNMGQGGPRRSSSTSSSTYSQQKQYQGGPSIASPHKASVGSAMPAYGHPMASIPPPPPPPTSHINIHESPPPTSSYHASDFPPPPMEPPAAYMPPPPAISADQFAQDTVEYSGANNRFSSESIPIAHLQPTPYDSMRYKTANDPLWVPAQYLCKVVTLYEYEQNKDDELSFQEQEVIYVVKKNNDGWWEGVMSNHTGLFPGNYVQVLD